MSPTTQQTQLDKIKADLLNGCQVDSVTAFSKGITRLAAIIKRLRERGWPVRTKATALLTIHYLKAGNQTQKSPSKRHIYQGSSEHLSSTDYLTTQTGL